MRGKIRTPTTGRVTDWQQETRGLHLIKRAGEDMERRLVILKYMLKTPWMAMCERCLIKFFTPQELVNRPEDAQRWLREKFDQHKCKKE